MGLIRFRVHFLSASFAAFCLLQIASLQVSASVDILAKKLNELPSNRSVIRRVPEMPVIYAVISKEKTSPQALEQFLNVIWINEKDIAGIRKSLPQYKVGKIVGDNKVLEHKQENGLECLSLQSEGRGYKMRQCWKLGKKSAVLITHTLGFQNARLQSEVLKLVQDEKLQ